MMYLILSSMVGSILGLAWLLRAMTKNIHAEIYSRPDMDRRKTPGRPPDCYYCHRRKDDEVLE